MTAPSNPHPDQRYIEALLSGEGPLLREIYERYSRETAQWIAKNKGTADDARDIFQEALMAIAQRARKGPFVLTCTFGAYLFLLVRGKWYNELKKRKLAMVTTGTVDGLKKEGEDAAQLAEETLLWHEREKLFQNKFNQLPEGCRQLLRLSWTGIKMEEVAAQLGITYAYARKRKSECIGALTASIQTSPEFSQLTQNP
jgi:RNA polymerase sigma factor (sigma-70 family)